MAGHLQPLPSHHGVIFVVVDVHYAALYPDLEGQRFYIKNQVKYRTKTLTNIFLDAG